MPNLYNVARKPAVGVLTALVLASVGLTACGGSSGSSTSANATSSTNSAATTGAAAKAPMTSTSSTSPSTTTGPASKSSGPRAAAARLTTLRECLKKNGIPLSKTSAPGGPTAAQFDAVLKQCESKLPPPPALTGGGAGVAGGPGAASSRPAGSPVFRQAFAKFATCLRQNGVNVPAPNASGNGPVFDIKGLDTKSAQFRTASMKCRSVLLGAFKRARPNGAAGGAATGANGGAAGAGANQPSG
jgi:hypothetical protein